jgi:hypothetical protein
MSGTTCPVTQGHILGDLNSQSGICQRTAEYSGFCMNVGELNEHNFAAVYVNTKSALPFCFEMPHDTGLVFHSFENLQKKLSCSTNI